MSYTLAELDEMRLLIAEINSAQVYAQNRKELAEEAEKAIQDRNKHTQRT